MEIETREAALCLIVRERAFLVVEIQEPRTGLVLHRPPGGGMEDDESPEEAVQREIWEELAVRLTDVRELGTVEHVWFWKEKEVRERAWLYTANAPNDARWSGDRGPELIEADGGRKKTVWRNIGESTEGLPALCPERLSEFLTML